MVSVSSLSDRLLSLVVSAVDKEAIITIECSYCFTKSWTFIVSEKSRARHVANRSKYGNSREIQDGWEV